MPKSTNPFDDNQPALDHRQPQPPKQQRQPTTKTRTTRATSPKQQAKNSNPFEHPEESVSLTTSPDFGVPSTTAATQRQRDQRQQQRQQQPQLFYPPSHNPFDSDDDDDAGHDIDEDLAAAATAAAAAAAASVSGGGVGASAAHFTEPPPSAEASWQYLGDLPYRRIPIYQNVRWTDSNSSTTATTTTTTTSGGNLLSPSSSSSSQFLSSGSSGLAQFPTPLTAAAVANNKSVLLDAREMRQWIQTSTVTQVVGCPHGGPIAAVTLPLHPPRSTTTTTTTTSSKNAAPQRFNSTEVRILSNSGQLLGKIPFPQNMNGNPSSSGGKNNTSSSNNSNNNNATGGSGGPQQPQPPQQQQPKFLRSAGDIFKIGFTERGVLVVLMRDSLCFTYDIQGEPVLPPFFLFAAAEGGGGGGSGDIMRAQIYGQGVACVAYNKNVAIAEFLHESWDAAYLQGAHVTAREVRSRSSSTTDLTAAWSPLSSPTSYSTTHSTMIALVTPLSVASDWCASRFKSFRTIAVLPRHCTSHGRPEVFLSTDDHSVVVIPVAASMELVDLDCRHRMASPIVDMSFCPNGRFLACFTEASMLTVVSTSFETKVLDFDTSEGSSSPPLAMQWCGEDSVVLHWKNMGILMVGPYGDWLRFPYNNTNSVHLVPEMDACRVITDSTVELLQRVPPMTANLLRIGSIEGSALLLEAADAFAAGSISDDVLLTENPPKDVDIAGCIEAATKEFDIATQKRLLRAASYGMQFLKQRQASTQMNSNTCLVMGGPYDLESDEQNNNKQTNDKNNELVLPSLTTRQFVAAARKLRILNALRNPNVGFVLTLAQYDALTHTGIVSRLIAMHRSSLASRLAVYLRLPKAVQLYARASKAAAYVQKVHTTLESHGEAQPDSVTAERAIAIIQNENGDNFLEENNVKNKPNAAKSKNNSSMYRGAYATVAMAASKAGRPGVANLLLLLESSVPDKVPALISNGSYVDAMAVATFARDTDYIFSTLMQLDKACLATATNASEIAKAQSTFWQTVITKLPPEAFHTLRRYYMASGSAAIAVPSTAADVSSSGGSSSALGLLLRAQRYTDAGIALAKRAMVEEDPREQLGILQESSRVFSLGKETGFYKQCTDEYLELLKDQEVIRTKYGSSEVAPVSTSVTATIVSVLHYAATHVREQHRLLSDADKIAKKFRIPDRRLWHVKVKAFADSGQWSNLRLLADSRSKSPIGYAPFARAAIRGRQPSAEVFKYIDKITVAEERCDLLSEAGMWKRALEEAIRIRDMQRILNVKTRCNSPELQMQAEQALRKMG
ncbi:hypothetical protein ACA910_003096 [Epithemia clementina (nom. ined.)]